MSRCQFIPPYLLERVAFAHVDDDVARCGQATLAVDNALRARRSVTAAATGTVHAPAPPNSWVIFSADNTATLPGRALRSAGDPRTGDLAVDEAYAGVEASLELFDEALGRSSFDGRGATVLATVHYERNYDNAFWDGRQLVFGDGDGRVFDRFTKPMDVLAHEFTHAVTQHTAGLVYQGQSGALNEHISDAFASCVKQRVLGQRDPAEADWLIGEGIFLPSVNGRALRSMAAPGTAYDDPVVGRDPQVAHMSDYVHTRDDNGGVHLNSGIPNHAFHLTATRLGRPVWEQAAQVWYAALTSGIGPDADFARFATATAAAARRLSPGVEEAVADAWAEVGVVPARGRVAPDSPRGTALATGDAVVAVRRTGGFAGTAFSGELHLGDDPRTPEVEQLLHRIDLDRLGSEQSQPDRFVYSFWLRGREVTVTEQALTPELSRLVHLLLDDRSW
ncbi:MAG: protealysin inhibitor emfourin [Mycobacteriales bacterium]